MLHHVVATLDRCNAEASALERPDDLRSRYNRDTARHKAASYQQSGYVECHSDLIGWANYIKQSLKRRAQVCNRFVRCRPIADRAHARPDLSRGDPDAVLILLDGVGHMNVTGHRSSIA